MSNQFNLSVKDFQIIKGANLSFLPGLNCIIGQSNNGKSALFRAAKSCIYNIPGTSQVRLGASNYAVGIQVNGHTVILQKGTNNIYKIDGQTINKIGRTQLEEVAKALNIKELNLNGTNEQINFLDQMEKPFLLDRSETELFRFIVDSGKDNNITTALKSITQDRQQITRDITLTEGKLQALEQDTEKKKLELANSKDKLDVCERVIAIGPKIQRVKEIAKLKETFEQDNEQLLKSTKLLENTTSIINKVESPVTKINNIVKKSNLISQLIKDYKEKSNSIKALEEKISSLSAFKDSNLSKSFEKYKLLSELISSVNEANNELKQANSVVVPEFKSDIKQKLELSNTLRDLVLRLSTNKKARAELEEQIEQEEIQIRELNESINKVGICPTCGRPLHS